LSSRIAVTTPSRGSRANGDSSPTKLDQSAELAEHWNYQSDRGPGFGRGYLLSGTQVGALEVEKVDAPNGRVKITITTEIYDVIGRYATWRFHEGGVFDYRSSRNGWSRFERSFPYLVRCT
jgi:hypothetical protein